MENKKFKKELPNLPWAFVTDLERILKVLREEKDARVRFDNNFIKIDISFLEEYEGKEVFVIEKGKLKED